MAGFTSVDLSKLPPPKVVEIVDFEVIVSEMLAKLREIDSTFDALVESDPAFKILEVAAYREMLLRERVNAAARAVMLAYAVGADLDNLGALLDVERLTLDPGNEDEGIPPTMEGDVDYRRRIQLSPEGFSVAGPEGAYVFHALSADPRVLDASVTSPEPDDIRAIVMDVLTANGASPLLVTAMTSALDGATWPGEVIVSILSREGDGTASDELLDNVEEKLAADNVRPMTDSVTVQSAEIVNYTIEATIYTFAGPDSAVVMNESGASAQRYVNESHRMRRDITLDGVYAALRVPGVQRVVLASPLADIAISEGQASYAGSVVLTYGGIGR